MTKYFGVIVLFEISSTFVMWTVSLSQKLN